MKILFVYLFCGTGGVEVVLHTCLREMIRRGINAKALFLHDVGGGRALFVDMPDSIAIVDIKQAVAFLQASAPDFLISIDTPQIHPLARQAIPQARFIYAVHTTYPEYLSYLRSCKLLEGVHGVIVPSQAQSELASRLLGRSDIPKFVVPNPIALAFLKPVHLSVVPTKPIIAWVGRLDNHKNWLQFVELAAQLRDKGVEAEFWLVGGARSPREEKRKLWLTIKERELVASFRWLPFISHAQMPRLYAYVGQSNGCLTLTSRQESFGMTALEAMACRCPVVAPGVGGLTNLVMDGQTGLLYQAGNLRQAANCVLTILADQGLRTSIVEQSYHMVRKRHTPKHSVTCLLAALAQIESTS